MPLDPHCSRVLALVRGNGSQSQDLAARRRSLGDLGRMAGDGGVQGVTCEDVGMPAPHGVLTVRRYRTQGAPDSRGPAILYLHGGGWVAGGLDTHDGVCRALTASSGFQLFSVDYRLAPEHPFPAAIDDALTALRRLHAQAPDLGIDPARLVMAGDSAGANIAVGAAAMAAVQGIPVARLLLICPILDPGRADGSRALYAEGHFIDPAIYRSDLAAYLGTEGFLDDPRISASRIIDPSAMPPAHVHVAQYDPFRDEGLAYAERQTAAGAGVRVTVHAGMIHYFYALPRLIPYAREALAQIGRELAHDLG